MKIRSVAVLAVLAAIAMFVAGRNGVDLVEPVDFTRRLVHVSLGALAAVLLLGELIVRLKSPEQRRNLWAHQAVPENNSARVLWILLASIAAITEEIIFRGALFALFVVMTNSVLIAAVVSALIYALAHVSQGWKSMVLIFGIALILQWLVQESKSLIPAMVVHVIYNLVRGIRASVGLGKDDLRHQTPDVSP